MMHIVKLHIVLPVLAILLACHKDVAVHNFAKGEVTFTNPLLKSGADPWVEQKDGWYYVTHTTGKDLRLYKTKRMSDLASAEMKTVWTPPATGMNSKQIWAPEIHFIQGKWYFYYAADDGDNAHHRMWVLENSTDDPLNGEWVDRGELELPDDKWAIDGTVFEHQDALYFVWSGWEGDVNVRQDIYIAKMSDPTTVTGERVRLSKPEYEWELKGGSPAINEAPQYLEGADKIFIVYSASGCWTDDYTLGMLSAPASADPLDASAWTKHSYPLFQKDPSASAYGPGHNSFFTSPDGTEDWMLYHANPESRQGCKGTRSPRMQPFTWSADGLPDFGTPVALGTSLSIPSEGK